MLHDRAQKCSLHPRFVKYLDNELSLHTWEERDHFLRHQPLQWWADRMGIDNSDRV